MTASIGWLGAALAFLGVAAVGLNSEDAQTVRGAYLVMQPAAWLVLVPLAFASLVTGLVMSLGTTWGLFRHYWVVFKLLITVFSTTVLLIYMETFRQMAGVAADPGAELDRIRNASPVLHAALATLLLGTATVLAIYKPRGVTAYGRRKEGIAGRDGAASLRRERWMYVIGMIALAIALLVVISHLTGGSFSHHAPSHELGR